ncbi:MAG: hypothetical protein U9R25_15055 [Chloroflexota bacterium]|nr:hypothetical protein [Chloroflexota bacterium]
MNDASQSIMDGTAATKSKILIAVTGQDIVEELSAAILRRRGHWVDKLPLSSHTKDNLGDYDLVAIALNANQPDGLTYCVELRQISKVPVLILVEWTARNMGIQALELGADSFMLTPYDRRELVARAEALIRRYLGFTQPAGDAQASR